jgi:hypothetical protein
LPRMVLVKVPVRKNGTSGLKLHVYSANFVLVVPLFFIPFCLHPQPAPL